jgi:nitronate monooxygenase
MGADLAYIGSAFIATREANAPEAYKRMIVECAADDIIYSSLFTGVYGNYLKPSVVAAGMDPDNLPESDPSKMNFSSGSSKPKSWKEIWGSGQGIGAVKDVVGAAELVARLENEYHLARRRLGLGRLAAE